MIRPDAMTQVERTVLRTAMDRPSALADLPLRPEHFGLELHGAVWELIQALAQDGKPCGGVEICDLAEREGRRMLGHMALEIHGAMDLAPSSQPAYHAAVLLDAWRCREALRIAEELRDASVLRDTSAIDRATAALMALHAEHRDCEHTAKSAVRLAWADIEAAYFAGGAIVGVRTGLRDLDESLGGLHDSDLIVIGARPAMGKTGLLLGMVDAAAQEGPVGLISGEQPAAQVGLRLLAAESRVPVSRLRNGHIEDGGWRAVSEAVGRLANRNVRLLDRSGPDIAEVTRVARRWKHQHGIRALYVDYLQRLECAEAKDAPKHERVGLVARRLKSLARDLNIPVVALAQVNRLVEQRQNQRPMMSDLADSSEIEKEADQIMTLWRDTTQIQAAAQPAEVIVVKNRHGNIGTVHCLWIGAQTRFVDQAQSDRWSGHRGPDRAAPEDT